MIEEYFKNKILSSVLNTCIIKIVNAVGDIQEKLFPKFNRWSLELLLRLLRMSKSRTFAKVENISFHFFKTKKDDFN